MILQTISSMLSKRSHPQRITAASSERAPPELIDLIISHLVDDKATLLSCALVHSTWTRTSRHYLPPLTLVVSCPTRARELSKLLSSPRDTLSPSIAAITLVGYTSSSLFERDTGAVVRGTPRQYKTLIRALKHNDNTRRRWRMMLKLSSYTPRCLRIMPDSQ
ncbi:hypothetical protein CPB85DRAFT_1438963 [Mucidula mucida]|nr:hypothetical protein CPB85DRAFT_1438963 [Mucidula mucida]